MTIDPGVATFLAEVIFAFGFLAGWRYKRSRDIGDLK